MGFGGAPPKPHPPAHPGLGKAASVWPEEACFLCPAGQDSEDFS